MSAPKRFSCGFETTRGLQVGFVLEGAACSNEDAISEFSAMLIAIAELTPGGTAMVEQALDRLDELEREGVTPPVKVVVFPERRTRG